MTNLLFQGLSFSRTATFSEELLFKNYNFLEYFFKTDSFSCLTLFFTATHYIYQLIINIIPQNPQESRGMVYASEIFPSNTMPLFCSMAYHPSLAQNSLFEKFFIKITFSGQHWAGLSIKKCEKSQFSVDKYNKRYHKTIKIKSCQSLARKIYSIWCWA